MSFGNAPYKYDIIIIIIIVIVVVIIITLLYWYSIANYKANLRGKGTLSNLTSNNSNSALTVKKKNYKIYCLRERNHIHMAPFIAPNLLGIISFEQRGRMQKII